MTPSSPWHGRSFLLAGAIVLVALNLRPALSSVGPVLNEIMAGLDLSAAQASWLTTLPVLCLGLFGPLAPRLARIVGTDRLILAMLVVLAAAIALRGAHTPLALFIGTAVGGLAIGAVNVLLPGVLKRDYPGHAVAMTGVMTMAMCGGAAVAAGATVPLMNRLDGDWAAALAWWVVPALIAIVAWAPFALKGKRGGKAGGVLPVVGLWRDKVAWQVTLFMGMQSSLAYCVFGWLAPILRDRGISAVEAGLMVSVSVLCQLPTALVTPSLAGRARDQRLAVVLTQCGTAIGLMGCMLAPLSLIWGFAVILGLAQGASFATALSLIVLRSGDSHIAAHLSGMVQGVGYSVSAMGPLLVGLIHQQTGSWGPVAGLFLAIGASALVAGLGAGRRRTVGARVEGHASCV